MIQAGDVVGILHGYSMELGRRDPDFDIYGGCEAEVVHVPAGPDALVWIRGIGEVWIPKSRLRRRGDGG